MPTAPAAPGSDPQQAPEAAASPYTIRESQRAKYASLRMSAQGELEVVVPRGFDHRQIPGIVAQKRSWIERARRKIAQRQAEAEPLLASRYPDSIDLAALEQIWEVSYRPSQTPGIRWIVHPNYQLLLLGQTQDWELCCQALKRWTVQTARQQLVPWLARVSDQVGLRYGGGDGAIAQNPLGQLFQQSQHQPQQQAAVSAPRRGALRPRP